MIKHSLEKARSMGFGAVCIYGDLRYYVRFGFRCAEKYEIKTADGKFAFALMALALKPGALNRLAGRFVESAVFEAYETEFEEYERNFPCKKRR